MDKLYIKHCKESGRGHITLFTLKALSQRTLKTPSTSFWILLIRFPGGFNLLKVVEAEATHGYTHLLRIYAPVYKQNFYVLYECTYMFMLGKAPEGSEIENGGGDQLND